MLLKDRRFVIDELFFNRRLKFRTLKRYELGMMRVGNIKYGSGATGRSLNEVSPFKYLLGDTAAMTTIAVCTGKCFIMKKWYRKSMMLL